VPRITHIELNSDLPDTLAKFYHRVFGWLVQRKQTGAEDYWFLLSGGMNSNPGINAGMKKRMQKGVQWVPTIHVDSIDKAIASIEENGGKITHAKRNITSTGYLAYGEDPEGNLFGILEKDSSVK
jgi:uncharacterized protein